MENRTENPNCPGKIKSIERYFRTSRISVGGMDAEKGMYLKPGTNYKAGIVAQDPDNDKLRFKWEIYHESQEKKEGGDHEAKPRAVEGLILNGSSERLEFRSPAAEGPYRLFVMVYDGRNKAGTANIPFYVKK